MSAGSRTPSLKVLGLSYPNPYPDPYP